jgi:hypothetical protein
MKRRPLLFAACAVLIVACGGNAELSGSVSEIFDIDNISRVEVRRNDQALQLTYLRNRGVFLDVVVRVAVDVSDVDLKANTHLNLADVMDGGTLRTSVVHAPGGEPVRNLPEVSRGDMIVIQGGHVDEQTNGTFSMLFKGEGGDLAQGRTLVGSFAGVAKDAGYGEPCPPCLP